MYVRRMPEEYLVSRFFSPAVSTSDGIKRAKSSPSISA